MWLYTDTILIMGTTLNFSENKETMNITVLSTMVTILVSFSWEHAVHLMKPLNPH